MACALWLCLSCAPEDPRHAETPNTSPPTSASAGRDERADGKARQALPLPSAGIEEIRAAIAARRGAPLLVNFWAVWCDPCVEELPDLATIEPRFASRGLRVLGVACDLLVEDDTPGVRGKIAETLEQSMVRYPNLVYTGGQDPLIEAFALPGPIPHSILFGPDGAEMKRWTGRLPLDDLESALKQL